MYSRSASATAALKRKTCVAPDLSRAAADVSAACVCGVCGGDWPGFKNIIYFIDVADELRVVPDVAAVQGVAGVRVRPRADAQVLAVHRHRTALAALLLLHLRRADVVVLRRPVVRDGEVGPL